MPLLAIAAIAAVGIFCWKKGASDVEQPTGPNQTDAAGYEGPGSPPAPLSIAPYSSLGANLTPVGTATPVAAARVAQGIQRAPGIGLIAKSVPGLHPTIQANLGGHI